MTSLEINGVTLAVGQNWRMFFADGNINNHSFCIRAIVDDDYVVTRRWNKSKQDWDYSIKDIFWFHAFAKVLSVEVQSC